MTSYRFYPMTLEAASRISRWTYPEPYAIYGMGGDEESLSELMNGDYEFVTDRQGELVGFICTDHSARVPGGYDAGIYEDEHGVDLGLGLDPDLTGRGLGSDFVIASVRHVAQRFAVRHVRLAVMTFNERAKKVYEKAGFEEGVRFHSPVYGVESEFVAMACSVPSKES
ncbi:GNAT family N-acetyltransferase [Paenibacillus spongiae]|uniref:GNAT family N-acetyltransferase n=1 Tax=Paenibacillus spongiae TaxID=2909671 RepID=A0ABY5S2Z9_9BACL|nr:GNAT family protein [Paenibacillus spongiae]UVI28252.1 GNAT family N-acetyltransferase [Paenibacillus spongiae]